ncbi:ABC transporter ATP-binding protein [Stenoxybacter acetivorans]|uniref:iron ABC transporter ATP-binding protein n=1 Tax=Stenoxybacter acetivorans TaxID=422441 RepID=UPI0005630F6B|nr:ATP-binding cassette domain-containing protein [Stenoxybacter acetivorans]
MISIEHINYRIGNTPILTDINLTLAERGITALIGANGAGKSTLLSLIARLQPLQSGQICVGGLDVNQTPSIRLAQKLAILTQSNHIHSRITVADLLMFGRYPHNHGLVGEEDRTLVQEALHRFDLTALSNRYLSELSGGQRQRALIAMTFCQQTEYVLLDEPLNNLDIFHARELMRLLRHLTNEQNLHTVMVVHDINMAAAYADHIVAMKDGKIAMQGTPTEMITEENLLTLFDLDADVLNHNGVPLVVHHI